MNSPLPSPRPRPRIPLGTQAERIEGMRHLLLLVGLSPDEAERRAGVLEVDLEAQNYCVTPLPDNVR